MVCIVSDGVTEAMNEKGELYGTGRLGDVLRRNRSAPNPAAVVDAVRADVAQFVGDAEVADDLTVLVLRWNGPSGR